VCGTLQTIPTRDENTELTKNNEVPKVPNECFEIQYFN